MEITTELFQAVIEYGTDQERQELWNYINYPWLNFVPRQDAPPHDQQTSFVFETPINCIQVARGGNACLAPDTLIYDPIAQRSRPVSQIAEPFFVHAYNQATGRIEIGKAGVPFIKGREQLYQVRLSNGQAFECSASHRILSAAGYVCVDCLSRLLSQSVLCPLVSSSDTCPLECQLDDPRCNYRPASSLADCRHDHHSCDEQLLTAVSSGLASALQSADVLEYSRNGFCADGQREPSPAHSQTYQSCGHQTSSRYARRQPLSYASENCVCCKPSKPVSQIGSNARQSLDKSDPLFRTNLASAQLANQFSSPCNTPYVLIESIEPTRIDLIYDFEVAEFRNYVVAGIVHHNSGKSEAGAYKTARIVKLQPPPVDLCKFLLISETMEQAANIWQEKLSKYFKPEEIQSIDWWKSGSNWPNSVILAPHTNGNRWKLVFKSFQQGMKSFSGVSQVGGVWGDEMIPLDILTEAIRGCREFNIPGSKFLTFTPIQPWPEMEAIANDPENHPQWKFYRLWTKANTTLQDTTFLDITPIDMRATREYGDFSHFSGSVFKEWNSKIHVIKTKDFKMPPNCSFYRSIDLGFEHETVCIWIAKDLQGISYVYREWGAANMLTAQKVEAINGVVAWDDKSTLYTSICDPEDAQSRAEMANLGLPTTAARKETDWSVELVQSALMTDPTTGKPRLYVVDCCEQLIRQIRSYRWAPPGGTKKNPKPSPQKPLKVDDDYVDALRYYFSTTSNFSKSPWDSIKTTKRNIFNWG